MLQFAASITYFAFHWKFQLLKSREKALCGSVWKHHHRIRVFAETSTRRIVQLINFQQNKQKTFTVPIFSNNRICCSLLPYETVNCPMFIRSVQKKKSKLPTEDSDKMQVAYSHCWFIFLINKSYMHAANTTSSVTYLASIIHGCEIINSLHRHPSFQHILSFCTLILLDICGVSALYF